MWELFVQVFKPSSNAFSLNISPDFKARSCSLMCEYFVRVIVCVCVCAVYLCVGTRAPALQENTAALFERTFAFQGGRECVFFPQ